MKNEISVVEETKRRIQREINYYGGKMPDEAAAIWHGYIAALLEWKLISVEEHELLNNTLPSIRENPDIDDAMQGLFLGRDENK